MLILFYSCSSPSPPFNRYWGPFPGVKAAGPLYAFMMWTGTNLSFTFINYFLSLRTTPFISTENARHGILVWSSNPGRVKRFFVFSKTSSPALEPTPPTSQWVPGFFIGGAAAGA